jgi:hypothetical protein
MRPGRRTFFGTLAGGLAAVAGLLWPGQARAFRRRRGSCPSIVEGGSFSPDVHPLININNPLFTANAITLDVNVQNSGDTVLCSLIPINLPDGTFRPAGITAPPQSAPAGLDKKVSFRFTPPAMQNFGGAYLVTAISVIESGKDFFTGTV